MIGDLRWAGGFGVRADFIAMENCHIAYIETRDILVTLSAQAFSSFHTNFLKAIPPKAHGLRRPAHKRVRAPDRVMRVQLPLARRVSS